MESSTIAVKYIIEAIEAARQSGADVLRVIDEAGLNLELLHTPGARITSEQYVSVMMGLMRITRDEFLGVGGKRRSPRGSFGMMCHSVIHLPTLRKAVLRAFEFYNILLDDMSLRMYQQDGKAIMTFRIQDPSIDQNHVFTEAVLTMQHRFSSWLIGQRIPLIEATFSYAAPDHVAEYHKLFHCPLKFNQRRNSIVFNAHYLNYPLMQNERTLAALLRHAPANLFIIQDREQTLTAQIIGMLGKDFTREFPDFEAVATDLGMAPQTLRRRLKDEGNSYQDIKDNLRRDAAIYYLSKPHLSINEITYMMGFSEPSTFHRAFKKWTGLTPGDYRLGLKIS